MRVTILRMYQIDVEGDKIHVEDCFNGKTFTLPLKDDTSPANDVAMHLNKKGIKVSHMAISIGGSIALFTDNL